MSIKKLLIVVLLALGAYIYLAQLCVAAENSLNRQEVLTIRELTETEKLKLFLYEKTNYDYQEFVKLSKIIQCESSWRSDVYGDSLKAKGLAQFWEQTFNEFSKQAGLELSRDNPYDQIRLLVWAFQNNKESHWTCTKLTR